jgi:hypothetical protein
MRSTHRSPVKSVSDVLIATLQPSKVINNTISTENNVSTVYIYDCIGSLFCFLFRYRYRHQIHRDLSITGVSMTALASGLYLT